MVNRRLVLFAALYVPSWGAMAINVFFLSLIGTWLGLPVLPAAASILLGAAIAVPVTWWFAGYMIALADAVDRGER